MRIFWNEPCIKGSSIRSVIYAAGIKLRPNGIAPGASRIAGEIDLLRKPPSVSVAFPQLIFPMRSPRSSAKVLPLSSIAVLKLGYKNQTAHPWMRAALAPRVWGSGALALCLEILSAVPLGAQVWGSVTLYMWIFGWKSLSLMSLSLEGWGSDILCREVFGLTFLARVSLGQAPLASAPSESAVLVVEGFSVPVHCGSDAAGVSA
jgi:hypothetical protein